MHVVLSHVQVMAMFSSLKKSFVRNLILCVVCLFMLFVASMTIYLMHREEAHHVDLLHARLQAINHCFAASQLEGESQLQITNYATPFTNDVRITVLNRQGDVLFESTDSIAGQSHKNHLNREEVKQALAEGEGFAVIRSSETTGIDYFYSATTFGDYIVRSALPYDTQLRKSLASDRHYLYVAIIITFVLLGLFLYMTRRLSHTENDNQQLQTRLQFEQEYNQYKRELSSNIAHELKTPVSSIQGYLETILDARAGGSISDEQLSRFLERSYSQSQRLNALVRDIVTLNRMDAATTSPNTHPIEKETIDVARLVRDILSEVSLRLELQQMQVFNALPHSLMLRCNPSMLYSIFRNLIDNAIAYSGKGSRISIELMEGPADTHLREGGVYHFRFADNGPGVADEHLTRIFERFYRVDKGRSRRLGGTGLGLAIVKNAVIMHGGTITARNRQEGGLEFDFTLLG